MYGLGDEMASFGSLLNKLRKLSEYEHKLLRAFDEAEKDSALPSFFTLDFKKMHNYSWPLCKRGQLKWYFSPVLATSILYIGIIIAYYVIISSLKESSPPILSYLLSIIFITVLMAWTLKSEQKAHHLHTRSVLNSEEYAAYSFGIKNSALMAHYFLQKCKEHNLKKNDISAIIKIVKCSHEHEDVSFGIADHFKKLLFGSVIAIPLFVSQNQGDIGLLFNKIPKIDAFGVGYILFLCIYSTYLIYSLIFLSVKKKKRRKRYILVLNLIHESWID